MNKILKKILILALSVVCALALFACSDTDDGNGDKGLLCKKIGGVYTIYKYVDDGRESTELKIADELKALGLENENIKIKTQAFNGNNTLTDIIVPDSVTTIEKGAFAGMKALKNLTVPFVGLNANSDTSVNDTAPSADKAVDAERTVAHFFGEDSYDEGVAQTINYGTSDGQSTTCYMPSSLKQITVKGNNNIPASAFNGMSKFVKIVIDGNVEVIGDNAFANTSELTEISLPATVKKINDGAFQNSTKLAKINLNELTALEEIGKSAFEGTALTKITMPTLAVATAKTVIGESAFKSCSSLTELTLSASVSQIGRYAFMNCVKLEAIVSTGLTAGSIKLGNYAFNGCEKLPTTMPTVFDVTGSVNAYPA